MQSITELLRKGIDEKINIKNMAVTINNQLETIVEDISEHVTNNKRRTVLERDMVTILNNHGIFVCKELPKSLKKRQKGGNSYCGGNPSQCSDSFTSETYCAIGGASLFETELLKKSDLKWSSASRQILQKTIKFLVEKELKKLIITHK
jgi:histone H3/H4